MTCCAPVSSANLEKPISVWGGSRSLRQYMRETLELYGWPEPTTKGKMVLLLLRQLLRRMIRRVPFLKPLTLILSAREQAAGRGVGVGTRCRIALLRQ